MSGPDVAAEAWLVWSVVVPFLAGSLAFLAGRRLRIAAALFGLAATPICTAAAVYTTHRLGPVRYRIGGWGAPLGIDWLADGLSMLLVGTTGLVLLLAGIHAVRSIRAPSGGEQKSGTDAQPTIAYFWPLYFFLWGSLNALFLSNDAFNLYVCLELLGFSSAALMAQAGREALTAAIRYLFVSLLGSLLYLLGVALLFGAHGTLDLQALRAVASSSDLAALALMTTGLLFKTALFPLHFWLPAAHANAPAPVSAALSGLVVKASFYLLVRLWAGPFAPLPTADAAAVLGTLGAAAIVWGSVQALRQRRLKMLIAYSTVAQLGYLFLLFPLGAPHGNLEAWTGGLYYAVSHALAKSALFLCAGCVVWAAGHDRLADLKGIARPLPVTMFAFALAGVTLLGIPPSGGFVGKWNLVSAAVRGGHWAYAVIIYGGGLLAAGYVFRVLAPSLLFQKSPAGLRKVPWPMEAAALTLAIAAVLLDFLADPIFAFLAIGRPFAAVTGGLP